MILTNGQIYSSAQKLIKFNENFHKELSVVLNYYIQNNINKLMQAGIEIEKSINFISNKYGESSKDDPNMIIIKDEYKEKAQKELDDLASIKQNIDIHLIKLSELKDLELSSEDLQALLFMIEDDLSNQKELKEETQS